MKNLTIIAFLFLTNSMFANELPSKLDDINNGISAQIIDLYDPNGIIIKLHSGKLIRSTYSGIEFETLFNWNNSTEKRKVLISFSSSSGVVVKDIISGKKFNLNGAFEPHIIELYGNQCEKKYSNTIGIKNCKNLTLQAWDAELNRAYKELGGSSNKKLKTSQLAWIKFRDKQIDYLKQNYNSRKGTMWGIVYLAQIVLITKEQTLRLKSIKEW